MATVSITLCADNPSTTNFKANLQQILQPLGGLDFFTDATVCLYLGSIWPAPPQLGLNPLPQMVQALTELLQAAGAQQISLAASAAAGFDWQDALQLAEYNQLTGLKFVNLAETTHQERESSLNLAATRLNVPEILLPRGCLINIAKLRVAEGQLLGTALLNLQAALSPSQTADRTLVDLHSIIQPDLHLIDCCRGQKGLQPQQHSALLAGRDAVALDLVTAAVAGLDATSREYLTLAAQYGLGSAEISDIHVVGQGLTELFGLPEIQDEE